MILSNKMSQKMNSIRTLCPQCLGVSSSQCPQHQIYEWSLKPLICKAITRWRHTLGVNKNFQEEKGKVFNGTTLTVKKAQNENWKAKVRKWVCCGCQHQSPLQPLRYYTGGNNSVVFNSVQTSGSSHYEKNTPPKEVIWAMRESKHNFFERGSQLIVVFHSFQ